MSEPTSPPLGDAVIRTIAMPADTNPSGDIFGGWLMAQMDLAAGNAAGRRARGRCATIAMNGMVFHRPVSVGDELSLYATIRGVGRTSMTIDVEAWRRRRHEDEMLRVTQATFTFVALDQNGSPRPISACGPVQARPTDGEITPPVVTPLGSPNGSATSS